MSPSALSWPVARDLIRRTLVAELVVLTAVLAVGSVAAMVEGHPPAMRRLLAVAAPVSAFLGGAWSIAEWRSEGGDVVLAGLGVRPVRWLIWIALLLAPGVADPGPASWSGHHADAAVANAGQWRIQKRSTLGADELVITTPANTITVRWPAGGADRAIRDDLPDAFDHLPPPTETLGPWRPDFSPWWARGIRLVALVMMLGWLAGRTSAPGLATTLGAAGAAFLGSEGLAVAARWMSM